VRFCKKFTDGIQWGSFKDSKLSTIERVVEALGKRLKISIA